MFNFLGLFWIIYGFFFGFLSMLLLRLLRLLRLLLRLLLKVTEVTTKHHKLQKKIKLIFALKKPQPKPFTGARRKPA